MPSLYNGGSSSWKWAPWCRASKTIAGWLLQHIPICFVLSYTIYLCKISCKFLKWWNENIELTPLLISISRIGRLSLQVYVESVAKANFWPINADQQKTEKATDTIEKLLGGLSHSAKSKVVQSFPVTLENMSHEKIKKSKAFCKKLYCYRWWKKYGG